MNPVAWIMERLAPPLAPSEARAVFGLSYLGSAHTLGADIPGQHDRDNFTTNRITVADYKDGAVANEAGALTVSTAWACVNLLAGTQGSLSLNVLRPGDQPGSSVIAEDNPLQRIVGESPNDYQTALDYWEFMTACLELRGNAYSEIIRRRDDTIVALDVPIVPDQVRVRRATGGALEYRVNRDGREEVISQNRMLHIRGFGGSPLGGLSTLEYAARTLGFQRSIEMTASATIKNGVRPPVSISVERDLSADQVREARNLIAEGYAGAMNAGRPYFAHSGQKIESLDFKPEDHLMLNARGMNVEEICRFFGVPPFMVGHTEKSTSWGTGLEQQMRMFYMLTLRRRLKRIEQALRKQLLTPVEQIARLSFKFNVEDLLRGDSKSRGDFYASGLQNGWRTINEVRALEGLPPVEGGEVPRMQMQVVPITEAGTIDQAGASTNED